MGLFPTQLPARGRKRTYYYGLFIQVKLAIFPTQLPARGRKRHPRPIPLEYIFLPPFQPNSPQGDGNKRSSTSPEVSAGNAFPTQLPARGRKRHAPPLSQGGLGGIPPFSYLQLEFDILTPSPSQQESWGDPPFQTNKQP